MRNPLSIAVVEDNASIREAIAGLLRSHGHVVAAFGSAEQFLQANPDRFDFLLSDMQMPGMSGLDLVDWLGANDLQVPTVLMTACVREQSRAQDRGAIVLLKPFSCEVLADTIRSVLGSPPAT